MIDRHRGTGRTDRMLQRIREYHVEHQDHTIFIVAHSYKYAYELAKKVPGTIPLGPGDHDKLRGAIGKAFIDHHFYTHTANVRPNDYRNMIEAQQNLDRLTANNT